ncbi:hypothetical protein [Terricaulis silvestris]|uniref:Uncharacterized protein n=1 Tax=Terricaulis silvestris TaxID=2686094 RepID=A0A6I6MHW0_9CAUL|nr:hypothetical protein [Terricaulis silvestris]QGZ94540.1 hypothetical protein DSM104635_01359 [Terricaulis silvestris]
MRILIALLVGSAASAVIVTAAFAILNVVTSDGRSVDFPQAMATFGVLALFANLSIASTIGLFWHASARVFGLRGLLAYALPAVAVGALLALTLIVVTENRAPEPRYSTFVGVVNLLSLGASLGGLTAVFAWLIRRPDRDPPNPPTPAS